MIKKALLIGLLLSIETSAQAFDHWHANFTRVLRNYNTNGLIDYRGLKSDPTDLNNYIKELAAPTRFEYEKWSTKDKIAFWINAYNALTLKAIIDNYPIRASFFKSAVYPSNSIRQISGVWTKLKFNVIGKEMTLNEIEHETLRKKFREPRIHMALVCAAMSCPPLRGEAYVGDALKQQLDDQSKKFLSKPNNFRIDSEDGVVYISSILDWFGEDFDSRSEIVKKYAAFEEPERSVLNFISRYLKPQDQQYLETGKYKTKYLDYDWSLNEQ